MTISQRIFSILTEKKLKQKDLAEYVGISTSAISDWKKKNTNPSAENLSAIADFLNVSLRFLLTGEERIESIKLSDDIKELISYYNTLDERSKGKILGKAETLAELTAERAAKERAAEQPKKAVQITAPAADEQPEPEDDESEQGTSDKCVIPYYDYPASAGTGLFLDETIAEDITVKATPEALSADFAIPIDGDSMEKDFSSGDTVLVRSCPNIPEGQIGIFVLDGDVYIKEYGGDCLISHNSKYKPIMLKDYGLSICLGRVLGKAEVIE